MPQKPAQKSKHDRHDDTVADSFPASDPPSHSGITGVRNTRPHEQKSNDRPASHERGDDARPTGHPTSDRHATETAHSWEDDDKSRRR